MRTRPQSGISTATLGNNHSTTNARTACSSRLVVMVSSVYLLEFTLVLRQKQMIGKVVGIVKHMAIDKKRAHWLTSEK